MTAETDSGAPVGRDPDAEVLDESAATPLEAANHFMFLLGESAYAIETSMVEHVAAELQPVAVPTAPAHVLGVVYVRGQIVGVVDLHAILGISHGPSDRSEEQLSRRLVVLAGSSGRFGIVADRILGLSPVATSAVRAPTDESDTGRAALIAGQFDIDGQAVTLLKSEALLRQLMGDGATESKAQG